MADDTYYGSTSSNAGSQGTYNADSSNNTDSQIVNNQAAPGTVPVGNNWINGGADLTGNDNSPYLLKGDDGNTYVISGNSIMGTYTPSTDANSQYAGVFTPSGNNGQPVYVTDINTQSWNGGPEYITGFRAYDTPSPNTPTVTQQQGDNAGGYSFNYPQPVIDYQAPTPTDRSGNYPNAVTVTPQDNTIYEGGTLPTVTVTANAPTPSPAVQPNIDQILNPNSTWWNQSPDTTKKPLWSNPNNNYWANTPLQNSLMPAVSTYVAPRAYINLTPKIKQTPPPPIIVSPKSGDNNYDEVRHDGTKTAMRYLLVSSVGIQGYFKVDAYAEVSNYVRYIIPTDTDPYATKDSYTPSVFVSAVGITGAQAVGDVTWSGTATVYQDDKPYSTANLGAPPAGQDYVISSQTSLVGQASLQLPATGNIRVDISVTYTYNDGTGNISPRPAVISIPLNANKF